METILVANTIEEATEKVFALLNKIRFAICAKITLIWASQKNEFLTVGLSLGCLLLFLHSLVNLLLYLIKKSFCLIAMTFSRSWFESMINPFLLDGHTSSSLESPTHAFNS